MIPSLPTTTATTGTLAPQTVSSLRLLLEGGRALLDASVVPAKLPPLMLGEQVSAQVVDSKDNGQQLSVLIKNSLFNLIVPQGMTVSGNNLSLKVATLAPTLSFALQEQSTEAAQDGSVEVQLSPASKYLTGMLQTSKPGLPATDLSLDVAKQQPAETAQTLKNNVSQSGLFYESHLKEWLDGRHNLSQVQQEPQSRLLSKLNEDLASTDSRSSTANSSSSLSPRTVAPELANLVQRQLDIVENQQLQLNGYAWPGQPMQLQIQQEHTNERTGSLGADDVGVWSTSLSLKLPALGGVAARVRLVGQNVQVSFVAEEDEASGLIQQHAEQLQSGMAAAGLTLANLVVKNGTVTQD
ncbi:flagellar hook-length control protein FliK [Aquitalea sp. LB_tupeE]|uniref:flagellar hook-length control protein FliK n=1 Tax=Aquitalea sp. LB_tupeE TaxID=2748078 RepID=UPI0015BE202D|nr:flagellar hook-length control protein FliK [Aquitalea sp. LB_tupeE]NWK77236.1 flagellar hook-length control protein FliK [Aquitalea sp. LB_tupeE]